MSDASYCALNSPVPGLAYGEVSLETSKHFVSVKPLPKVRRSPFTVVSLFAGCGGMDLGFKGGFTFLGKLFAVSPATVHDWRHGEKLPSAQTLAEIATKLRVNYDWLATGRGEIATLPSAATIALARRIERIDEEAQEYIKVILTTAEHRQHIS